MVKGSFLFPSTELGGKKSNPNPPSPGHLAGQAFDAARDLGFSPQDRKENVRRVAEARTGVAPPNLSLSLSPSLFFLFSFAKIPGFGREPFVRQLLVGPSGRMFPWLPGEWNHSTVLLGLFPLASPSRPSLIALEGAPKLKDALLVGTHPLSQPPIQSAEFPKFIWSGFKRFQATFWTDCGRVSSWMG